MMSDFPDQPGHRGVDTSIEAAAAIAPSAATLQTMVLLAIGGAGARGMTTNEVADALGRSRDSIQPRTSELRSLRKIIDSGQRRKNASGINAIVWTLRQYEKGLG